MHLDISLVRSVITVVWFVTFVALWLWAWSGRRRQDFAAAANLPLEDEGDRDASKTNGAV